MEGLANSFKYPEIDCQAIMTIVQKIIEMFNKRSSEPFKFGKAQIEICFISATRNDSRTDRSLCRGEFLEFIIRMAQIKYKKEKEKEKVRSIVSPMGKTLVSKLMIKNQVNNRRNSQLTTTNFTKTIIDSKSSERKNTSIDIDKEANLSISNQSLPQNHEHNSP